MIFNGKTELNKDMEAYAYRKRWWAGMTLGDIIDKGVDAYPEKTAVVDDDGDYTYIEILNYAKRLALGLTELGIAPTDRVLLQLPNWREFIIAYFALQKIGAVPVILIARYRQYEINHLAKNSDATAWIVAEKFHKTNYIPIIEDVRRENSRLAHVIVCRSKTDHEYTKFEDLIENTELDDNAEKKLASFKPTPEKTAHMGPTGGTTGIPKIAPHTHNSYLCKAEYSARASELNQDTVCLVVLPAAHDLPFANGILSTLVSFGKLVLSNETDPEKICRIIEKESVNTVIWVPTLTYRMLSCDAAENYNLQSLSLIYCGGGLSTPEMIREAKDKFNCTYLCGYGGTEGMLVTTRRHDDYETCCNSIGKPTCPHDHYMVIDDCGRELPPDSAGQLVVKGPSIISGYLNMPEENAQVFTDDGYFKTGDLAAIDEKGYIHLCGRVKDTIKRGGESIFAAEIERLIGDHPDVAISAVIGIPDPEMGERVCAVIQTESGNDMTLNDLVGYLKSRDASVLQFPEFIHVVDKMPLTATGKVDKKNLKESLENSFGRAAECVVTDIKGG